MCTINILISNGVSVKLFKVWKAQEDRVLVQQFIRHNVVVQFQLPQVRAGREMPETLDILHVVERYVKVSK